MAKPFSYGYSETKCESCNDVASYVENSSPIVRFLFNTACPIDVEKTVGDDGVIKDEEDINKNDNEPTTPIDTTPDEEEKKEEEEEKEEEIDEIEEGGGTVTDSDVDTEEESSGLVTFIAIGATIIILAVGGFAVLKVYTACKSTMVK